MQGPELLVPILAPLGLFAMIFGIVYLRTRENMALIEKGINPKEYSQRPAPFKSLKTGCLLLGAGIGLLLAYIIDYNMAGESEHEAIYFALIAIGGGLGLITSYRVEKKEWLTRNS